MKFYKIILILILFLKTETLFSENKPFNVSNILLEKKENITNNELADKAIQKGFIQLITRILLKEDVNKLSDLSFSSIKQLVAYYQISNITDEKNKAGLVNFSITFDKDKVHDLFYKRSILYSEFLNKELYILPVLIREDGIYVFNNNFFYKYWNDIHKNDLIEFILPIENIEIIRNINDYKNNLINLKLFDLFKEYKNKNVALILIDDNNTSNQNVYIKAIIQGKEISKGLKVEKDNLDIKKFYEKIIINSKKELINLVKSKNLIDIRTPSFLNAKLDLNKKNNFVELNLKIKKIDSIENIYVQQFNKNYMNLRIKYLGKLEKIINQLKIENIDLQLINDQWVIKIL